MRSDREKFHINLRTPRASERAMIFGGTPPDFVQTQRARSASKQTSRANKHQTNTRSAV